MTRRPAYTVRDREPSVVSQVEGLLTRMDDFVSFPRMVELLPGCSGNAIAAALSHLRKFQAVGAVPDDHGLLHWYATPDTDTRSKKVEMRVKEPPGNRGSRRKKEK